MEIKETKQCPYCGEEILAIAKKCRYCGEWLTPKEEAAQPKMIPCPTCGENVEEGTKVCPYCKETISQKIEAASVSTHTRQAIVQPDTQPQNAPEIKTFFKDFWTNRSLTKNLFILFGILIGVLLVLAIFDAPESLASIGVLGVTFAMTILIIQRIVQDRRKVDLITWLAIGSSVLWIISTYVGQEALSNPGLDILGYGRANDSSEGIITFRYAMKKAMVWFVLSCGLDCGAKYLMWKYSKEKFKTTMVIGLIASVILLLYVLAVPNMDEQMFILMLVIMSIAFLVYCIMILINGIESDENVADISRAKQTDYNERIDGYNNNTTEASPKVSQERTVIQPESLRSEESKPIANLVLKNDQAIAVDLGLSVKWADCNVGGTSEAPVGGLFGWADPTGNKTSQIVGDYVPLRSFLSHAISENISGTEYDIATVQWGGNWRMPTKKEWKELIDKCKWSKESQFNVMGYRVEGPNGNSIFLPCTGLRFGNEVSETDCGYYWTSEMVANDRCMAHYYYFDGEKHNDIVATRNYVYSGRAIRPVCDTSERSNLKDDTPSINEEPVVEELEKPSDINKDSIQATLENSQQGTSSEVATSNDAESVQETATNIDTEETSENGFILSNKVILSIGLFICLLYFLNDSLFTIASFGLTLYGLFLSLLVIKRVVLDKDKRVKPTWLAVVSFAILLIAIFIPVSNPDYHIKSICNIYNDYPFVVYSQYTMQRTMIWFVIAFAVDCISKLFIFKSAKQRCKLPLNIYMIGCLLLITFAFVGKYVFDGVYICLLLLACAPLLLSNIMLLYRGSEDNDIEDMVNGKS